jgi:hypothetical protein
MSDAGRRNYSINEKQNPYPAATGYEYDINL